MSEVVSPIRPPQKAAHNLAVSAVELADVLLLSLAVKGGTACWLEPVHDKDDITQVSIEKGRATLAQSQLAGSLADAVIARLALLCELDLIGRPPLVGRAALTIDSRRLDVLLTVRRTARGLCAEIRPLDERGVEVGQTLAKPEGADEYPEVLSPGMMVGPYRVEKTLGQGGMGVVYRAQHTLLKRQFALKILLREVMDQDPESARRFVREARAAARIRDGGIVDVTDFGNLADGRPYLVMELLAGESVADRLARDGAIDTDDALSIIRAATMALRAAHNVGVVHRDLTPSNIFLCGEAGQQEIKVLDFGAAKLPDPEHAEPTDGPPKTVFGTPYYMAPEHAQGHPTDARADIYALGCCLFEMLSGRVPFFGNSVRDILIKHILDPRPTVQGPRGAIRPEVQALVKRMMSRKAEDRHQSCDELIASIESVSKARGGWQEFMS